MDHVLDNTNPFFGVEHPSIFATLWKWLENTYTTKAVRHPTKYDRYLQIRDTMHEVLVGWCLRMKQIHIKPPSLIRLSMMCQFYNCPSSLWNILSHLRLICSPNTTKKMYAVATAIPISVRQQWDHHSIAVLGADNMSYTTRAAQVRHANNKTTTYTMLHTINIWQRYHPSTQFPQFSLMDQLFKFIKPNEMQQYLNHLRILPTNMQIILNQSWIHSSDLITQQQSHLAYPIPTNNITPPQIEFKTPLFDLVTSKYLDMEVFLNHIYLVYLRMLIIYIHSDDTLTYILYKW
jgi:hypothetical protein